MSYSNYMKDYISCQNMLNFQQLEGIPHDTKTEIFEKSTEEEQEKILDLTSRTIDALNIHLENPESGYEKISVRLTKVIRERIRYQIECQNKFLEEIREKKFGTRGDMYFFWNNSHLYSFFSKINQCFWPSY
jgi:hypothetical protein